MLVELDRGFGRRDSHAADGDGRLAGHLDQQRHFAAQPEAAQFGDAGGQGAGDAGIHRVAALREDAVTGLDFEIVGRSHHLVGAAHRRHHGVGACARRTAAATAAAAERLHLHGFILALSSINRYFRSSS